MLALLVFYAFLWLSAIPAIAEQAPLKLDGVVSGDRVSKHLSVFMDYGWTADVRSLDTSGRELFQPTDGGTPDFGYTDARIWLRLDVENADDRARDFRLYMHENFKQVFHVYIAREDGSIDHPLALDRNTPFWKRPISFPEMVAPMELGPRERATIYIGYWSEGSSYLNMSIETAQSFTDIAARKTARNFIFYGMMLLLIIGALAALVVLRHRVFLAYAAYASAALLFVMQADGVTFQYLWPSQPGFNSMASVYTGTAIIIFGSIYSRVYLRTALLHPVVDRILLTVIGVTLALNMTLIWVDAQLLKKSLILMSLIAVLSFAGAGFIAALSRFSEVRFYLLAWAGAVISAALLNLRHMLGIEISQDVLHDSMRAVMVFDAAMMGLAIADGYNQLRQSRQDVLHANLKEAERNLALNRRLGELEQQYQLAQEIARTRSEQIQNTVHDLRQPLHALRLSVENHLSETGQKSSKTETIEATFGYLENLISEQLQASVSNYDMAGATEIQSDPKDDGKLDTRKVLRSIHEMFLPDAEEKGLTFRLRLSEVNAAVPPLVLMRIVSNLVSNAIKYTDEGGVLLIAAPHGDKVRIEVHDTGPGLSEDDFERAQERSVRLKNAEKKADGHGLGLSIAIGLAREHGLTLSLAALRQEGTGIVLEAPRERQSPGRNEPIPFRPRKTRRP